MTTTCHPSLDRLAAYGMGRLPGGEAGEIEEHLGACEACQAGVETTPDDALALLVRDSEFWASRTADAGAATRTEYGGLRFFAKGGLGEVSLARDAKIGREVAIKRLSPRGADSPERRKRFLREATVTGRLEHPGIVPVYGIGEDEAGQPCYAMRFVPGDTLQDAIRALHRTKPAGEDWRPLLGRFVSLCSTVAYAHSRGVVHRDIKPSNVAVGSFGETILLDWGLAQTGDDPAQEPVPESGPAQNPYSRFETATGTVLGTPGYMAPEQAAGQRVGPPADVFSLGVTLWALLCGRTPAEPGPESRAPAALLAVARKAMATAPADRYESAAALAADVERWLADKPLLGVRDPLAVRLGRWGRRHRLLVASSLAALAVAAAGAGLSAAVLSEKNGELRDAVQLAQKNEATATANGLREQAATKLAEAREQEALANFRTACDAVDRYTLKVNDNPRLMGFDLEQFRQDLLDGAVVFYRQLAGRRDDDPKLAELTVRAHVRLGQIRAAAGDSAGAKAEYQSALARLDTGFDPKSRAYLSGLSDALAGLFAVARMRNDHAGALDAIQQAHAALASAVGPTPATARDRADAALMQVNLAGALARARGDGPAADAAYDSAFKMMLSNKAKDGMNQVYWETYPTALREYAAVKRGAGNGPVAEQALVAARTFHRDLATAGKAPDHALKSNLAEVCLDLGDLRYSLKRYPEAAEAYAEGAAAVRVLAALHPTVVHYQDMKAECVMGHGRSLLALGDPAKAETAFREAYGVLFGAPKRISAADPYRRRVIESQTLMGVALARQTKLPWKMPMAVTMIRKAEADLKPGPGEGPTALQIADAWCDVAKGAKDEKVVADAFESGLKIAKSFSDAATARDACAMLQLLRAAGLFKDARRAARLGDGEFQPLRALPEYRDLAAMIDKKEP